VCKVELISIELPMVVNGAALMKLWNLGGVVEDLRRRKKVFWGISKS
jgi:hypothetical protein